MIGLVLRGFPRAKLDPTGAEPATGTEVFQQDRLRAERPVRVVAGGQRVDAALLAAPPAPTRTSPSRPNRPLGTSSLLRPSPKAQL